MRRFARVWAGLALAGMVALAGACGGSETEALRARAFEDLRSRVAAVREAAERRDHGRATRELNGVVTAAAHWQRGGALTAAEAQRVVAAASGAMKAVALIAPPPPTPRVVVSNDDHEPRRKKKKRDDDEDEGDD